MTAAYSVNGWCVEWVSAYKGDSDLGLDPDGVEYTRIFFTEAAKAKNHALRIASMDPSPCVMGDIAIHDATFSKHGKLTPHWRVDDDPDTEWIEVEAYKEEK